MDTAANVISIAGLSGVFTSCIDCYDLIRLGVQFSSDYGRYLLRLDVSKLRLARWGCSIGLGGTAAIQHDLGTDQEGVDTAKRLLNSILDNFSLVEQQSKKYSTDESLNADVDLEANFQQLHISMRKAAEQHVKSSMISRAAWVIYRRKDFDRLVQDIAEDVDTLTTLFPAAQTQERALARTDAAAIQSIESLQLIGEASSSIDTTFENEVKKNMEARGHVYNNVQAAGFSKLHAGDKFANDGRVTSHVYNGGLSSENSTVHLGNDYGVSLKQHRDVALVMNVPGGTNV